MSKRRAQLYRVEEDMPSRKNYDVLTVYLNPELTQRITKYCHEEKLRRPYVLGKIIETNLAFFEDGSLLEKDE